MCNGPRGDVQNAGDLVHREAREEAHLDDPGVLRVLGFEVFQGFIEGAKIHLSFVEDRQVVLERNPYAPMSALLAAARTGMVDENPSQRLGRYGEEMGPVTPLCTRLIHELEVCFMDQRGRLQCVIGSLVAQHRLRQDPQFAVNLGQEPIRRPGVAVASSNEQAREVFRLTHRSASSEKSDNRISGSTLDYRV
jgi:hypothetical protein